MWPDKFLENLYWNNSAGLKPDYETIMYNYGLNKKTALNYVRYNYERYPDNYYINGGQLPEVTITPENITRRVRLDTYYPFISKKYPLTGHSKLVTPGGNRIDVKSSDPDYNLITQNCSDATREALENATGQKINPWFFTTPGDVRSFAENTLGGKSVDMGNGLIRTFIPLPQSQINSIARYAQDLNNKRRLYVRQKAENKRNQKLIAAGKYKGEYDVR